MAHLKGKGIEAIPVTDIQRGNYAEDKKFRACFQTWLNTLWMEKALQSLHFLPLFMLSNFLVSSIIA